MARRALIEKHPRMSGDQQVEGALIRYATETPPHERGSVGVPAHPVDELGNTPA